MVNHPNRKRKIAAFSHDHDADYAALLRCVKQASARNSAGPLFCTTADLNETYLDNLGDERDVHTCSACRRFIHEFGGLVTISEDGHATSAFWNAETVPEFYRSAIAAMVKVIGRAKVTGPFLSPLATWGTPATGEWTHFSVKSPNLYRHALLTAGQAMAAKREDFNTVARALADFPAALIAEAIRVLETGHLASAEKFITPLNWLAALHAKRGGFKASRLRDNILWRAIATAPAGFCHPRAAVTATLLEDIAAGMSFADVKARWSAKVHPLQYQRPQAAPAAGNVEAAEKIVEKLGIARALERRYARLHECDKAWSPVTAKAPMRSGGVFSHLSPKGSLSPGSAVNAPASILTWSKFVKTVLPAAEGIEAHVSAHSNFIALTTAVHADAPPVLKWDRESERNPVAWYVYHGGSSAVQWNVNPGWVKVTGIVPLPPLWGGNPLPNLGEGYVLVLDGCVDTNKMVGNALFPECLLGDLHSIRSTIEAFSRRARLSGRDEASACGLDVRAGMKAIGYRLRVTTGGLKTEYQIDRWD